MFKTLVPTSLESYVAQLEQNYVLPAETTLAVTAATETVTETIERLSTITDTSSLRQFRYRNRNRNSVGLYTKPNPTQPMA
jgi:hypothetical protein